WHCTSYTSSCTATSLNDMTIIKPISTSNSNVDAGDANEFRKTIKSVTTNSNPNLMRQDKDQYTIFLEKKLKSLETLLDLSPGCNQYNYELSQYKKVSHLFSNNTSDYSRPNSSNMVILPLPSPSNKPLENTNNNGSH
ncbi:uncharacterized protein FZC25_8776g1835, partial [Saccharomyces cerevisiae]